MAIHDPSEFLLFTMRFPRLLVLMENKSRLNQVIEEEKDQFSSHEKAKKKQELLVHANGQKYSNSIQKRIF